MKLPRYLIAFVVVGIAACAVTPRFYRGSTSNYRHPTKNWETDLDDDYKRCDAAAEHDGHERSREPSQLREDYVRKCLHDMGWTPENSG